MTRPSFNIDPAARRVLYVARAAGSSPVKALRKLRGLTLMALASTARMDPAQLDLIEQQSELGAPMLSQLASLARALRVPVEAVR